MLSYTSNSLLSFISTKQYLGCSTMKYLLSLTNKCIFYWRKINKQQLPPCKVNRMSSSLTNISTRIFFSVITKIYNCLSLLLIQQKDTGSKFIISVSLEVNLFCFNEIVQSHTRPQREKRWNVMIKLKKKCCIQSPCPFQPTSGLKHVFPSHIQKCKTDLRELSHPISTLETQTFSQYIMVQRLAPEEQTCEPSWLSSLY